MDYISKINENSNIPIPFLTDFTGEKISGINYINNYMSKDYICDDYTLVFEGYPDDESKLRLVTIKLRNSKYNIIGIKTGDNVCDVEKIIKKYGFIEEDIYNTLYRYKNDEQNVSIEFRINNGIIYEVTFKINTKCLGNRIY